jgi:hypothetical protein
LTLSQISQTSLKQSVQNNAIAADRNEAATLFSIAAIT